VSSAIAPGGVAPADNTSSTGAGVEENSTAAVGDVPISSLQAGKGTAATLAPLSSDSTAADEVEENPVSSATASSTPTCKSAPIAGFGTALNNDLHDNMSVAGVSREFLQSFAAAQSLMRSSDMVLEHQSSRASKKRRNENYHLDEMTPSKKIMFVAPMVLLQDQNSEITLTPGLNSLSSCLTQGLRQDFRDNSLDILSRLNGGKQETFY
jgi:hypothetical protein